MGRVEDELGLRRLAEAYAAAVDRRDAAALLDLFLPDGRLSVIRGGERSEYAGRAELATIVELLEPFEATLHEVVGQQVEIEGEEARCETTGVAHHVSRDEGGGASDFVMYLHYRDRCRRAGEGWRFAARELTVLWTERRRVRLP